MYYKDEKNRERLYQCQLSDKINPITIAGLILLFSIVLTVGAKHHYLIALISSLGLLFLFDYKKSFKAICTLVAMWGIVYFLKLFLGNVLVGSIYIMLLIILKFFPVFVLGKILSMYSSSRLIAAFRYIGIDGSISVGVSMFFRFIPEISIRMKEIQNGMKIRGFRASIFKPLKSFELYFVPLIYKCIDISDTLTCSIISKGIEYEGKKTTFHKVSFTVFDIVILIMGLALLGVSVWEIF